MERKIIPTKVHFRALLAIFLLIASCDLVAQERMKSEVHPWNGTDGIKTKAGFTKELFSGSGAVLSKHVLNGVMLEGGRQVTYQQPVGGDEMFFVIKKGPLAVTLNGIKYTLDQGSIVFVLSGDVVQFHNQKKDAVSLYEMRMVSNENPNVARGLAAGPSFVMNWFDMVYKPTEKGGVRQLFSRPTAMSGKFDIHITSLNPGISSHPPHVHKNEEIILMLDGEGEMQFGPTKHRIETGGAAWVESMIPHNFTNLGNRPAVYFAIQWN